MQRTWVILGATSIIAEKFAHIAAQYGSQLLLVGRQHSHLNIIAKDIKLRFKVPCEVLISDLVAQPNQLLTVFQKDNRELDLFLAHSDFTDNSHLNTDTISHLIKVNILTTTVLINAYLNRPQKEYNLLFLSSVAAGRGRSKNSLYGASKATIELYLEGIQQSAAKNQHITIARLGFIDTKHTYGLPGIFYAASPLSCAKACWKAVHNQKRMIYFPSFWRVIMAIINRLPFFLYRKLSHL